MKIIGTGCALPKQRITNDDLAKVMDTSDEWIRSRTGIGARHLVNPEENTTSLAVEASKRALESANLNPEDLDLIIAATVTADHIIPTLSCEIQAALGAKKAVAFDISAACSGFIFALSTADSYMKTGKFKNALVIGAETLSKIMNYDDRSTCVLFGDGAGAVVVNNEEDCLLGMEQGSDGASGMVLRCVNRFAKNPFINGVDQVQKENGQLSKNVTEVDYVHMEGQAVYKFAVTTVPKAITNVVTEAGLNMDDIDLFVLHQANMRIIESVAKRLKQPMEKFPTNMQECGNVSAASVPILLDKVVKDGMIKKGDKIALAGFGAGLTWGACVIEWR